MISRNAKKNLIFGLIAVFFDDLGYSIIAPILPYLTPQMGATAIQEGFLYSSYSITKVISLYFMGYLSDYYGRRLFILLSLFGSCIGAFLQASSKGIWQLIIGRSVTGLFAGSGILAQAMITDLLPPEDISRYLSISEAVSSSAFIIGPVVGSLLSVVSLSFPLYFSGGVAGTTFLVAFFLLDESKKEIKEIYALKEQLRDCSPEKRVEIEKQIKNKRSTVKQKREDVHLRPTMLMCLCIAFEFCNRWSVNAYEARYGYFIKDKFGIPQQGFSIITSVISALLVFQQACCYGWITKGLNISIPGFALFGVIIETISFFFVSFSPFFAGCLIAMLCMWFGFSCASPASVSILSTSSAKEVQGAIIGYNRSISQVSLILSPIVLSAIYAKSRDATYYSCMIFSGCGVLIMCIIRCLPNGALLGKAVIPTTKNSAGVEMRPIPKEENSGVIESDPHSECTNAVKPKECV